MTTVLPKGPNSVLLASDDSPALEQTRLQLQDAGISPVRALADRRAILPFLEQHNVSVIVLGVTPDTESVELLTRICRDYPDIQVVVETASSDVELAVSCMKAGAADYMVRPVESGRMSAVVEKALNEHCSHQ